MKRLTEKNFDGEGYHLKASGREHRYDAFNRLAAYEDTGLEPEEVADLMAAHGTPIGLLAEYQALGPIDRLRELAQADREGRCVVPPCKSGDFVFCIHWDNNKPRIFERPFKIEWTFRIGRTVFLTREEAKEAKAALEAQKGAEDE